MGDLQKKTDPALRVVRAFARLIFAVIYLRRTKCQSLSVTAIQPDFAAVLSAKRDVPGMRQAKLSTPFTSLRLRFQPCDDRPTAAGVRQSMDSLLPDRRYSTACLQSLPKLA